MWNSYLSQIQTSFDPDPTDAIMPGLFQQYEQIIIESLITSFGLDFLIHDQEYGDVDTLMSVHNTSEFKNRKYEQVYDSRGQYVTQAYHADSRYISTNRSMKAKQESGTLTDSYTGRKIGLHDKSDLDHVISAKEIHDDKRRILSGLNGVDLANSPENLRPTDRSINRSMRADSIEDFCKRLKKTDPQRAARLETLRAKPSDRLTEKERQELHKLEQLAAIDSERMKSADVAARKSYGAKLAKAYYTSPQFAEDVTKAAGKLGAKMGLRQALGFVFAEMWFAIKQEFQRADIRDSFDLKEFLTALGNGLKRGFENAKDKYREILSKFLDGTLSGILSSLTTTLCSIFFHTAKNVVRIIRQSYASLVEAIKILFINPNDYPFGERMRTVAKILATGASIVVGTILGETLENAVNIPVLKEVVSVFCSSFVSGIMSCTLLYFLDRSKIANKLVQFLNRVHTIEDEVNYYRHQAEYFEQYAAQLMEVNLEAFQKETCLYCVALNGLEKAQTLDEQNAILEEAVKALHILLPWTGDFDTFMGNPNNRLVFQ